MFTGLSSLRAQEKKPKAANAELQDYLKKYTTPAAADEPPKKKRKKVKAAKPHAVNIVDADITGFERSGAAPLSDEEPEEPGGCRRKHQQQPCMTALTLPMVSAGRSLQSISRNLAAAAAIMTSADARNQLRTAPTSPQTSCHSRVLCALLQKPLS
jgi:hypothetical protein